jgi:Family of unknown function (DUF7002)
MCRPSRPSQPPPDTRARVDARHVAAAPHLSLVDDRNVASIRAEGLRSAGSIVNDEDLDPHMARNLLRSQRQTDVVPSTARVLRNQRPIPPRPPRSDVRGCEPSEWYERLNQWVYLWLDPRRVNLRRHSCTSPQRDLVLDSARCWRSSPARRPA